MQRSGCTIAARVLLIGGSLTMAAVALPAQQQSLSKATSQLFVPGNLPVLNLQLGKDADHAFAMHGKMDIPLMFQIDGAVGDNSQLQLATVIIRNGRVTGIGRSAPFSMPGKSLREQHRWEDCGLLHRLVPRRREGALEIQQDVRQPLRQRGDRAAGAASRRATRPAGLADSSGRGPGFQSVRRPAIRPAPQSPGCRPPRHGARRGKGAEAYATKPLLLRVLMQP